MVNKNILCFIDSLGSGGAQRQMVNLVVGFKNHGHNVTLLCYHDEPFFESMLLQNEIRIVKILESNYILRLFKIRNFIRNGKFDSVLSFLDSANFISIFSSLPFSNWKVIVGERNANPLMLKSPKLILFRYFFFFADKIVSNSNSNIQMVRKINPFLSESKFEVIYNIVDLNIWKPVKCDESLAGNDLRILIVAARFQFQKNFIGFIEAVNLLSSFEKSKLRVYWYGDEHANDLTLKSGLDLISKYNLLTTIIVKPAVNNLPEIISQADGIGLFSFFEGLSNSICEGLSCGKFILSSRVSDIEKFVDKSNGILFDPMDISSITEALRTFVHIPKDTISEMGKVSRSRAEIFFNSEINITKYLEILMK